MCSGSCERSAATAPYADRFLVGLVDDDVSFREALEGWLSACGVKVAAFASGEAFLDSEHLNAVSCLVLDVRMPGMDGLSLCRTARALRGDLPVIFVSSHDDAKTREHAIEAGAKDFLSKPLDSSRLLALIEAMRGG
jgi:FixJ family two-component response regulator